MTAAGTSLPGTAAPGRGLLRRALPATTMLALVLVGFLLPVLRTRTFYYWDDTAAAAVGVWQRIAESVLHGELPFLFLDLWRGGNFAAEAATGMWNPVMLALMIGTSPFDDVAVAITLAKLVLFLLTAGGVYLLARNYGASAWMAAVAGTALPLSGWSVFMDGTAWINGTAIFAFTPWAWWALRRCALGGFKPGWILIAAVVGYLVPSTGNPYGVLTLAVAYLAVGVELISLRRARQLWWLIALGLGTVLLVVVVYLPFVLTAPYGERAASGIWNDEFLAVTLNELLGMSTPTHRPSVAMWGGPMRFPGVYLAWFVLPLVPWLRWGVVRESWRRLTGLFVFLGLFLLFAIGPSQLGMFRWPARLVPFLFLAIIVLFAVVASHGLHRSHRLGRGLCSGALIFAGIWVAWSDLPDAYKWHGFVTVLVAVGVWVIVRWTGVRAAGAVVMAAGMVLFLGPQLMLTDSNRNVTNYQLPTSKSQMREDLANPAGGTTVQIFDVVKLNDRVKPDERWHDLLVGNLSAVAGFASTSGYSGIGFTAFDKALCVTYNGGTCDRAWDRLWRTKPGTDGVFADRLGATRVVVQRRYADDDRAPAGWSEKDRTDVVTVYQRDEPLPNPDGTITVTGDGVSVTDDVRHGPTGETATVSTADGDTEITFARIAWPGYTVTLDGAPVETEIAADGLLTATLPDGVDAGRLEVSFTPPGLLLGLGCAAGGLVLLAATAVLAGRRRQTPALADDPPSV